MSQSWAGRTSVGSVILARLKKPSVIISLVSQVVALCVLLGADINKAAVMTVTAAVCTLLGTLGVLSGSDIRISGADGANRCPFCGADLEPGPAGERVNRDS